MSLIARLRARRKKLNRLTYKPLVFRKGEKVDFSDTEQGKKNLEDYKKEKIAMLDKRMGVRSPSRRILRKVTGFEKELLEREMGAVKKGEIGFTSGTMEFNARDNIYGASGGVKVLVGIDDKSAYFGRAESLQIDANKKGLSAITGFKRDTSSFFDSISLETRIDKLGGNQ
tara:strand:+ start:487 stop:999 length:513 start_codon:yes stop_codon:yes gene_type:complete